MQKLLKHRWKFFVLWIVIIAGSIIIQPNLKQILNQKGEATIPDNEASKIASKMLNSMGENSKGDSLLLVFNDKNKISNNDMKDIKNGIDKLNRNKSKLKITSILDSFDTPEAKDQLLSKDKTTLLAQVYFERGTRDSDTVMSDFKSTLKSVKVKHYITGSFPINNDYLNDVGEGVDKSGQITIIFILVVLIFMFRSLITPLISLLAVGISYGCSMAIIGILIHQFNFPITGFTEMFVILILFGIGTDYHILLFNRFKEELSHGLSVEGAVVTSYRTAGRTILYSGITVLIAFASLTFVKFPVYKSANAVAIAIGILLIEIMTLTPIIMRTLGKKLFWPSKNRSGHKKSVFWGKIAIASVKHPIVSLIIVSALIAPVIIFNTTKLSFNSVKDLNPKDPSIQGFNLVVNKFGAGKVMQTDIVLKNDKPMDNNEDLAVIDNLTQKLKGVKGIKEVYGPTQPKGAMIDDLYTNNQTKTVINGLDDANSGVKEIKNGILTMNNSLPNEDFSAVAELSNGTGQLQSGINTVTGVLQKINNGIESGANGADDLVSGIGQLRSGVKSINDAANNISQSIDDINKGYDALGAGYKAIPASIGQLKQMVLAMQINISNINAKLPNDPDVGQMKTMLNNLSGALDEVTTSVNGANDNYDLLTSNLSKVNAGLKLIVDNTSDQSKLVEGINELENGEKALSSGLRQGSAGQTQVIQSMSQLNDGAEKIKNGQQALNNGISGLGNGIGELKNALGKSSDGLTTISDGINKSNDFLTQLTTTKSFYIPKEVFKTKDITKMLDMYMSKDRKMIRLTLTLASEPDSERSVSLINNINSFVKSQLKGTKIQNVDIGIAGDTAETNDLKNIATHDINFTQIIVLAAIFLLLVLVIRSFWIPIYIIASLMIAYFTSLASTMFISKILFSSAKDGLAWNVPFFAFIMIVSLGVDYSIFLMMRFKEYPELSKKEAIILSAKNIGGVVMSAAIILAGTFATLYPSNIIVLMELSICVVIGLFILSFILLPSVIPALISISKNKQKIEEEDINCAV
ncbi:MULTISPECIES: MMPL family transporter [Clostridium]|uniref:MMPL family transporter n=1 Tax=Clostridium TaxID=1485 RepID=UPI000825C580|nr:MULTISPECIES: MMPL family transporter [Clostridium]PJI07808.1 MMPL family transporter [Clostridium sp. CT7]